MSERMCVVCYSRLSWKQFVIKEEKKTIKPISKRLLMSILASIIIY